MTTVTQYWAPHDNQNGLYQTRGQLIWSWPLGDNSHYWGFAVRPYQGNMQVEVERQWTTSDNDMRFVEPLDELCTRMRVDARTNTLTALDDTSAV